MHRPLARVLEELAKEVSVEASEGEPLRAAGGCGDDVDILRAKTSLLKERAGISTGEQGKRTHCSNASRLARPDGRDYTRDRVFSSSFCQLHTAHTAGFSSLPSALLPGSLRPGTLLSPRP